MSQIGSRLDRETADEADESYAEYAEETTGIEKSLEVGPVGILARF